MRNIGGYLGTKGSFRGNAVGSIQFLLGEYGSASYLLSISTYFIIKCSIFAKVVSNEGQPISLVSFSQ